MALGCCHSSEDKASDPRPFDPRLPAGPQSTTRGSSGAARGSHREERETMMKVVCATSATGDAENTPRPRRNHEKNRGKENQPDEFVGWSVVGAVIEVILPSHVQLDIAPADRTHMISVTPGSAVSCPQGEEQNGAPAPSAVATHVQLGKMKGMYDAGSSASLSLYEPSGLDLNELRNFFK